MADGNRNSSAPDRVGIREFRGNLNAFLQEVQAGKSFVLTSHDRPIAEIHPVKAANSDRKPGALRGRIKMADDFDALPDDDLKAMEAGD
ncbi:type II toxin-antitoxin system Phd/YefM family antitoxin [Asticcacaulis solisilvae]|uniref:type II toxin-antitoxin system Phd/YefM family antitoxin n=1 Tax=Asticcacaulis solisilvae TaxID=1217274 RepID=UPI003FD86696